MPDNPQFNYPYAIVASLIAVMAAITCVIALWSVFRHNYSETIAACERHNFILADTGSYEMAKCVDPKTGLLYEPQYLGGPQHD